MDPLTVVTPVFEAEVPLLRLQARSFARHLPTSVAAAVIVLDNTARGLASPSTLRAAYGPLAQRVRILRPDEVCDMPSASGWRSQQVLKLAVADLVETPRYLVLDAKNHLVAEPRPDFLEAPGGRIRVRGYSYRTHPLRPALELVLTYLGLDPAPYVDRFAATVTPFTLDTAVVRDVVADVAMTSGRPFATEFVARELTEFFLYAGWIVRRDGTLDGLYELTDDANPVVWPRSATVAGVQAQIAAAADVPVFGVHRDAIPMLDPPARALLADFWAAREIVESPAAGVELVSGMQRRHARERRRQQVRDVWPRALTLARRVRARLRREHA